MTSAVTLRAVAELAGVSLGTASQALNNRRNVAPETRARVLEAATALGYPIRVRDASGEVSKVGMLLKHHADEATAVNVFYAHILAGVESECRSRGLSLMYSNVVVDERSRPLEWPAVTRDWEVDGLIMVGIYLEELVSLTGRGAETPVVLIDGYAAGGSHDSTLTDNVQGAFEATAFLIGQGHTCIGLVGSAVDAYPSIRQRREGYLDALRAHGIPDAYIQESRLIRSDAYEAAQQLLQRAPQITAIFACNDDTAIGALRAAQDMGLDVPGDLSVVGFDNIELASEIRPALTTVHVHKVWMGRIGVRCLLERAQNPDQPALTTLLATELVVRESVRSLSR